ncbi:hypothetical protein [Algoriphagus sp.]|uniref:hypothetical protein n=1 Tax=Algoriphagus sp. TaxID=1872435 RepID=UPI00257F5422|nr:hypothetical protein [Algoriphagus sp.]
MISNLNQSPLRTYPSIESYIRQHGSPRPHLMNYHLADPAIHYEDGFRDYAHPIIDVDTHKLGELIYDEEKNLVTREVIAKTTEELDAERKAQVPFSIAKLQAMIMLTRMGIKDQVLAMVDSSDNQEIKLYFEHAATWERASPIINSFAPALGMSQDDLDSFFIEASKIN